MLKIFVISTLFAVSAQGARVVNCATTERNPKFALEFSSSTANSARLISDVQFQSSVGLVSISSLDIAQYQFVTSEIFVMADDVNGSIRMSLSAAKNKGFYLGKLIEFDLNTGRAVRTTSVKCSVNVI